MISAALLLLLLAAIACLALTRLVPTRVLGFGAALASAGAGAVLLTTGTPQAPLVWAMFEAPRLAATGELPLTPLHTALGSTLLAGSTLALAALAAILPGSVRGFGGFFAVLLLALAAALLGLTSQGVLLPFSWALVALLGYTSIRISGTLSQHDELPQGVGMGLLASLLLLGSLLYAAVPDTPTPLPGLLATGGVVLASLMYTGSALFHHTLHEARAAPAALGGLLFGLMLPLLGLGTLLHYLADLRMLAPAGTLPAPLQTLLLALGVLSVLVCALGAQREHSLRALLAWLAGMQAGIVVLALGLEDPLAQAAAPVLLGNLALSTLLGTLAVAEVERLTGSDSYTQPPPQAPLLPAGIAWLVGGAAALGLPGLSGFWGRLWLFEAASAQAPWVVPPLLAASALALLAYLAPLALLLRRAGPPATNPLDGLRSLLVLLALALPLLGLLSSEYGPARASLTTERGVFVAGLLAGLALLLWLPRLASGRRVAHDEDMTTSTVLAPDALAASSAPLVLSGGQHTLLAGLWHGLRLLSAAVRWGLALFEQRFYLAGVVLALLSILLLMAQG